MAKSETSVSRTVRLLKEDMTELRLEAVRKGTHVQGVIQAILEKEAARLRKKRTA